MFKTVRRVGVCAFLVLLFTAAATSATLSPSLASRLRGLPDSANVGVVVIAFNSSTGLDTSHLNLLRSIGISKGITYSHLGMVGALATAGQLRALSGNPAVRSVWANERLNYYNNETERYVALTEFGMTKHSLDRTVDCPSRVLEIFQSSSTILGSMRRIRIFIFRNMLFKTSRS